MPPPARFAATRVRPGGFDKNGDPLAPSASATIYYYATAPRTQGAGASSASVDDRGRQGVIEGLTMYAPAGQDIRHTDQLVIGGVAYDVDGEMGDWLNPYSRRHPGVEINLRRAEG